MDELFMYEDLALVIAALPAVIITITVFVKLFNFIRNLFSDQIEYEAVVLKKTEREEVRGGRSSNQNSTSYYSIPYRVNYYFVTFKTEKHKKLKLQVDNATFKAINENDRGILTLQGKKFIKFEKKIVGIIYE